MLYLVKNLTQKILTTKKTSNHEENLLRQIQRTKKLSVTIVYKKCSTYSRTVNSETFVLAKSIYSYFSLLKVLLHFFMMSWQFPEAKYVICNIGNVLDRFLVNFYRCVFISSAKENCNYFHQQSIPTIWTSCHYVVLLAFSQPHTQASRLS